VEGAGAGEVQRSGVVVRLAFTVTMGTQRAAVLGSPVAHSLSPALHRAAYAELGLDWSYDAIECDEAALPSVLDACGDDFVGLSLTMPLKRAVLPLLDSVSPLATAIGAVNTVVFDGVGPFRRRIGHNTDAGGMVAAIRRVRPGAVASATILGAGGTASAAVAALRELGIERVRVVVRDAGRAGELLAAADRLQVKIDLVGWPGTEAVAEAELVIATTPAGATDALVGLVSKGQLLFDVLYAPWPTAFAAAAATEGAEVIGGLELLVQQATLQFELWSGRRAPVDAMRAAAEAALKARPETR